MKTVTGREAAEQRLRELEGRVRQARDANAECERIVAESRAEMDRLADAREMCLAKSDQIGADAARQSTALAARTLNDAGAKARGLARLLPEVEAELGTLAVALMKAWRYELSAALAKSRARFDAGEVSQDHVFRFVDAYREHYSAAQEVFAATGDIADVVVSFDLREELQRRRLTGLAPDFIVSRNVLKPRLREEWRPLVGAHLVTFRERREAAARAANVAAHAKREAAQRLGGAA